jgi:hypothetical protein
VDACRYLGALIAGAINGVSKHDLLESGFWRWGRLDPSIDEVARGSFTHRNPPQIKGGGYVAQSLEAALWAFHRTDTFQEGALLAVNLGDMPTRRAPYTGGSRAPFTAHRPFPQGGESNWSSATSWLTSPTGSRRSASSRDQTISVTEASMTDAS